MKASFSLKNIMAVSVISFLALSCQDSIDRENPSIPYAQIGGYQNSDEVSAANLVSKLSFENNLSDKVSNITATTAKNVNYAAGIKGMAYDGSSSESRYFVGDATPAITSLNGFTFSFWMKSANTEAATTPGQGKGAQGIFSIVRPAEFWGGMNLFIENPDSKFPDRIRLKLGVENGRSGVEWKGQSIMMNIDNQINKWIYVTFTYDPKQSKVSAYINGEPAGNLTGFAYAPANGAIGSATWFASDPGGAENPKGATGYGDIQMVGTNGKIVFGTHQFQTTPPLNNGSAQDWATSFAGQLDEFRIYKAPLSAAEVISLYKLEKDNR